MFPEEDNFFVDESSQMKPWDKTPPNNEPIEILDK